MRKTYLPPTGNSNLSTASPCSGSEGGFPGGRASPCTTSEASLRTNSVVMRVVHKFWPKKTSLELRVATGASERMIRYWISNRYSLSADHLAALLRTEAGFAVLTELMGDARPTWWKRFKKSVALSMLRAEQAAQQKRLAQLEMEFDE